MRTTLALAAAPGSADMVPTPVEQRELREDDVAVAVDYCGVCASDLLALDRTHSREHLLVPGHELTGHVVATGAAVAGLGVGDAVAVGNVVDSCGVCPECRAGLENQCRAFPTPTYGGVDRHDGRPRYGGFARELVASARFVHALPDALDPAAAAPLMCAGVTVWEPLRLHGVGPGAEVGVVGIGGLGHLAIRFATAMGARVTAFTTSAEKVDAARRLGADDVVVSGDEAASRRLERRLDLVVDCGSGAHDLSAYLASLRVDGTLCVLGVAERVDVSSFDLRWGRHRLTGSGTGSVASTREMLAFAAAHGVVADVEVLPAHEHAKALRRLRAGDVRWRFVLDMRALGPATDAPT